MKSIFFVVFFLTSVFSFAQKTIVQRFGKLSVKGNFIVGEYGDTVQLRGMSLFWSQWMDQYYNPEVIKWLRNDWKCTVVRAAMGVESGGYLDNPEEKQKVFTVVDAAIQLGIYVVIDYHSHDAHLQPDSAKKFFAEVAQKYGQYPNVLYEIYNEPIREHQWQKHIKPYAENVIAIIRQYDPDNIVIVGCRQWSQLVTEPAVDPIKGENIVYALHYYAATHGQWLRDEAKLALQEGVALFVSEFGTGDAENNGKVDAKESAAWFAFLDEHKISWCNWSISDKEEPSSALLPGANAVGRWPPFMISPSGKIVKQELMKNAVLFK